MQKYISLYDMQLHIMFYPDWLTKQRRKGTLVMRRGNNYYLYRVRSL
ncbi:MAG: hypothetical protein QW292_14220 [Candidatus Parvarchaeota archaeon]